MYAKAFHESTVYIFSLKMEVTDFSEKLAKIYQTIHCHTLVHDFLS